MNIIKFRHFKRFSSSFQSSIDVRIRDAISQNLQWKRPTEIQEQVIREAMLGKDIIASARAGTGKTGAYLIPLLHRHLNAQENPQNKRLIESGSDFTVWQPRALILVPNAELVHQVVRQFRQLASFTRLNALPLTSRDPLQLQCRQLLEHLQSRDTNSNDSVAVFTPGRLEMFTSEWLRISGMKAEEIERMLQSERSYSQFRQESSSSNDNNKKRLLVDFSRLDCLVMDEVDRLLSLNHYAELQPFLKLCSSHKAYRQTMLLSATVLPEYTPILKRLVRNSSKHLADIQLNSAMTIPSNIEQVLYSVQSHHSKHKLLMHLIENDQSLSSAVQSGKCVVVFTRTAGRAEAVARLLREGGYRASHIHSALPLPQKRRLLDSLRSEETNNIQFIVSPTDFLGRGVDVPTLSHVINYDVPIEPEQYLHSVGRCGRMKRPGTAITLVAREPAMVRLFDGRQKTQLDEKRLIDNIEAFLQRYDKTKETKRSFMPNFREIPSGFQEVHEDELSNREQSKNYEPIDKLPYYEQVLAEAKRKVATKRGIQIK